MTIAPSQILATLRHSTNLIPDPPVMQEEAAGKSLDTVFKIVNEASRHTVENPATRALREGVVVGLLER